MSEDVEKVAPGTHIRQLVDYDLQFLDELTALLDRRLDELEREMDGHPDPDAWGFLDSWDATAGLGFVACQNYLTAVVGKGSKKACLPLGPTHAAGDSIASIVNAGANYVKHHAEARPLDDLHLVAVMHRLNVWEWNASQERDGAISYPMGNLLFEALKPAPRRFGELLPLLERWRDAVIEAGLDG
jgi:hypothetical protein